MTDATAIEIGSAFDVLTREFPADPYPIYQRLRSEAPVVRTSIGAWLISRYDDISLVLGDPRFGKHFEGIQNLYHGERWREELCLRTLGDMMLFLDAPRHTRVRSVLASSFTARRVADLRALIQRVAEKLVDAVIEAGQMDIVADFSSRLPKEVIFDLLDIPEEDRERLARDFRVTSRLAEAVPMDRQELDVANHQIAELIDYFHPLLRTRAGGEDDDLITLLASQLGEISEEEIIANVILLFVAGHETTTNLISNAFWVLEQNKPELERLLTGEVSYELAAEELIRFESPVQAASRMALQDVRVGDVDLRRGEFILTCIGASNRDADKFAEPDRLDLGRKGPRNHSFGGGGHFCLGAQLARLELQIALEVVFRRLRGLCVDASAPRWRPSFNWRSLARLDATWA